MTEISQNLNSNYAGVKTVYKALRRGCKKAD